MTMDDRNRRPGSQQGENFGKAGQQNQGGAMPGQTGKDGRMPGQNQVQSGSSAPGGSAWQSSSQQQQFEQNQGQFGSGASGADSRIADQIREHMEVMGDDGMSIGRVDSVDGDQIKLTRSDSEDGQHHYIQCSDVAGIENDQVHLHAGARPLPGNDGS